MICVSVGSAAGSKTPLRTRERYEGSRRMPWLSTPRRSAWTSPEAVISAFRADTPEAVRRAMAKALASPWLTRTRLGVSVVVAMVVEGLTLDWRGCLIVEGGASGEVVRCL